MSDAPRITAIDQLTSRFKRAVLFERVKSRSLAMLLRDAVERMNGLGDDAEVHYMNDGWDAPQNILQWGRRFVRESIDNLRAQCGDGTADASESSGDIELYLGYFFTESVPERASTLCHESRHVGGHPHNAKFPKGSVYGEGEDGADSNWEYQGAWAFDAAYAAWYGVEGARTTSALQSLARQIANKILNNAFATHPGVNV